MATIKPALAITLAHEGYYANDPTDTGGETYRGIARNHNPNWSGWSIIDAHKKKAGFPANLKEVMSSLELYVARYYKAAYWDVNNLDLVTDQAIACELFDTGVNMGVNIAAKLLQEALNLCNRNQKDYPDMKVDGQIGPLTLRTLNSHSRPKSVLKALNVLQGQRYIYICERKPSQEKFFMGWLERVTV
ncbi:glycosyl hydrolase 108 family protein [Pontibacter saemangeumensis]|uniref:Glycosyl hydrolase 108 family protein n=1 Tax=Pontibacter saemangeumensis TaxID=1084525 RepID=A0ABP8LT34_9BACT